jgi:hypothetical protein
MLSGATCGSPAVSGTALCYHHSAVKTALGKGGKTGTPIPFVFPEDRAALQINYFLLLQAYADGRIDLRSFNSMQRLLRAMAANLGNQPLADDLAQIADAPATVEPSKVATVKIETQRAAATASVPCTASPRQRSEQGKSAPAPQPSTNRAFPSFEEIAAQDKRLGAECFLIAANQPRLADPIVSLVHSR